MHFAWVATVVLLGMFAGNSTLNAQAFYTNFGKNRVQFHGFTWSFYESNNFVVYFYQGGQQYGEYAVQAAEKNLPDIQTKLEYFLDKKIEVMVYHNISDLNQTNIGNEYENLEANSAGRTKVVSNKVFVYFNGDHGHLEKQIREGIARVYVANMLYGDNVQEVLQNAFLLNLPHWFKEGLIAYLGQGWSADLDSRLRDLILNQGFKNFNRMTKEESIFAGHAFWYYLSQNYNKSAAPNLLYLARINRSLESAFIYVIGQTLQNTIDEWMEYNNTIYALDENKRTPIPDSIALLSNKKITKQITEIALSKEANFLAYVSNKSGRFKVHLKNLETQASKVILKGGIATFDMPVNTNYPLLAWSKNKDKLAIVYQKRDRLFLMNYWADKDEKTINEITKFQQVLAIDFTDDDKKLIFSGVRRGQVDLFTYNMPNTKVVQITNDFFDDLQPSFYKDDKRRGILFSSNRLSDTLQTLKQDTILPTGDYDIFFYDLDKKQSIATRLYSSPYANEWQIQQTHTDGTIALLSDQNGIFNYYTGTLKNIQSHQDKIVYFKDSTSVSNPKGLNIDSLRKAGEIVAVKNKKIFKPTLQLQPASNFSRNINQLAVSSNTGKSVVLSRQNNTDYIFEIEADAAINSLNNTNYKQQFINQKKYESTVMNELDDPFSNNLKSSKPVKPLKKDKQNVEEEDDGIHVIMEDISKDENAEEPDTDSYFLDSGFTVDQPKKGKKKRDKKNKKSEEPEIVIQIENIDDDKDAPVFISTKVRPYVPKFSLEKITTQLDNSLMFSPYLLPNDSDLNGLFRYSVSDLMENHRIIGGFRFPLSFSGLEWLLEYQNYKKRFDKKFTYFRKGEVTQALSANNQFIDVRRRTSFAEATLIYPFDYAQSVRAYVGWRNEKNTILSTELNTLSAPDFINNWAYTKLEYVYDDTRDLGLNIKAGTRAKIFTELYQPFEGVLNDREVKFRVPGNNLLGTFGIDARHYEPLFRKVIFAGRFYGATSFGNNRILYVLGGVENWFNRQVDNSTPVNSNYNYVFTNQTNHLRGFKNNARNGNNVMILNAEIRIPLLSTLFNRTFKSDILNSFQLVPFFDFGTAWIGSNPFKPDVTFVQNTFPMVNITQQEPVTTPVLVTVNYFRNPFIGGYGLGFRTKILGYFLKFDVARGLDNGQGSDVMRYLSFGYDF